MNRLTSAVRAIQLSLAQLADEARASSEGAPLPPDQERERRRIELRIGELKEQLALISR